MPLRASLRESTALGLTAVEGGRPKLRLQGLRHLERDLSEFCRLGLRLVRLLNHRMSLMDTPPLPRWEVFVVRSDL